MYNVIKVDNEIFIDGHKFSRIDSEDVYITNGTVYINWNSFVTGKQYIGFNSILKYDGDIVMCDTSKIMAEIIAVTQDYSKAVEYAKKCGNGYYAVMNLCSE